VQSPPSCVAPKVAHGWEADASGDVFLFIRRDGPGDKFC
jgi:hypothetical protein